MELREFLSPLSSQEMQATGFRFSSLTNNSNNSWPLMLYNSNSTCCSTRLKPRDKSLTTSIQDMELMWQVYSNTSKFIKVKFRVKVLTLLPKIIVKLRWLTVIRLILTTYSNNSSQLSKDNQRLTPSTQPYQDRTLGESVTLV